VYGAGFDPVADMATLPDAAFLNVAQTTFCGFFSFLGQKNPAKAVPMRPRVDWRLTAELGVHVA